LKPLKKNIVIAQEAQQRQTESGIILSSEDSSSVKIGVVLHIGPEVTEVSIGDRVLPNWQNAKPITLGAKQQAVISEEDVLVILD
jgi:co-chaperonin GroES (HSP10)